jgi:hypothetical protein
MKKNFTYGLACLLLIASCKKFDGIPIPPNANEKEYTLKKMVHGTREYTFYYNKKRGLDSVGLTDIKDRAVYKIVRRNERIDSVIFKRNGSTVWYNTNVQYNSKGNITQFSNDGIPPGPFPEPVIITYNQDKVHSITKINNYLSYLSTYDTVTYNQQNDIVRWASAIPRSELVDVRDFTYDNKYNPLYFIEDLLIVFSEDQFLWEFFLSQHNSLTQYFQLYNVTVNYQNTYDRKNRLIKKVFNQRFNVNALDSLTFQYMK